MRPVAVLRPLRAHARRAFAHVGGRLFLSIAQRVMISLTRTIPPSIDFNFWKGIFKIKARLKKYLNYLNVFENIL